jgi:aldehyde dehydrogenase (NAD+)
VLAVGTFKTEEEAIKLANATTYGLGAGLHSSKLTVFGWTSACMFTHFILDDANQCMRVSNALEAGTVWGECFMRIVDKQVLMILS